MAQPCHYRVCRKWEGGNCAPTRKIPAVGSQAVRIENVLPAPCPGLRASSAHWVQRGGRVHAFVGASCVCRRASRARRATRLSPTAFFSATDLTVRGVRFVLSGWSAPALADGCRTQATLHLRGTRDEESIQLGGRICPPAAAVVVGGRARRGLHLRGVRRCGRRHPRRIVTTPPSPTSRRRDPAGVSGAPPPARRRRRPLQRHSSRRCRVRRLARHLGRLSRGGVVEANLLEELRTRAYRWGGGGRRAALLPQLLEHGRAAPRVATT